MTHWRKERTNNPCSLLITDYRPCVYASGTNCCVYKIGLFYFLADFEHTKRNL